MNMNTYIFAHGAAIDAGCIFGLLFLSYIVFVCLCVFMRVRAVQVPLDLYRC